MQYSKIFYITIIFSVLATIIQAVEPYESHDVANSAIDESIRNETAIGGISKIDVADAVEKSAAMTGSIIQTTASGAVTYHAPSSRTAANWFALLKTLLETAGNGSTFNLPPVLFQPSDSSAIIVTAEDITILGGGCTIRRGILTPLGVDAGLLQLQGDIIIENTNFNGNGDATAVNQGITVRTSGNTIFRKCNFDDCCRGDESYHIWHNPLKTSDNILRLEGCIFNSSGLACVRIEHGHLQMVGGELNIPDDRITGSSHPKQRLLMAYAKDGSYISEVLLDGVNSYVCEGTISDHGYYEIRGNATETNITDGILSAVGWTDHTGGNIITTGITQPHSRAGLSGACACQITATTSGTVGDINNILITIVGKNRFGESITETLPVTLTDAISTVIGKLLFWEIDSISIPAHDGAGALTEIGFYNPKLDSVSVLNCTFTYENSNVGSWNPIYGLYDSKNILFKNTRFESLTPVGGVNSVEILIADGCDNTMFHRCTGSAQIICGTNTLVPWKNTLLTIDNCDFNESFGNSEFIANAEDMLHIVIRDSYLSGWQDALIGNSSSNSGWDTEYTTSATVTLDNIQYRCTEGGSRELFHEIPRVGFARLHRLQNKSNFDVYLSLSVEERLMGSVGAGDTRTAYLGRRFDEPSILTGLSGASQYNTTHPYPADSGDAFPGVSGIKGDRIVNNYLGIGDLNGGGNSSVITWVHNGTMWIAESTIIASTTANKIINETPATSNASGVVGEIRWDGNYIYICVATNVWKRAPLATW